jgi:hypothetical protein
MGDRIAYTYISTIIDTYYYGYYYGYGEARVCSRVHTWSYTVIYQITASDLKQFGFSGIIEKKGMSHHQQLPRLRFSINPTNIPPS